MTKTARQPAWRAPAKQPTRRFGVISVVAVIAALAVIGLYVIYRQATHAGGAASAPGGAYEVGQPGIGATAPPLALPATTGTTVDLASYRGRTVLLYFQEGLGCQPCWDQLRDLERSGDALRQAGVDAVVSVTTDPLNLLQQKVSDEHLSTPVLSDSSMSVSNAYHANDFGMMGHSRDGHTFILVGSDGKIRWRADYGGAPRYTMYVPVSRLLGDMRAGRRSA